MINVSTLPTKVQLTFLQYYDSLSTIKSFSSFDSYLEFVLQKNKYKYNKLGIKILKSFAKKTYNLAKDNRLICTKDCQSDLECLYKYGLIDYFESFKAVYFVCNFYNSDFYIFGDKVQL